MLRGFDHNARTHNFHLQPGGNLHYTWYLQLFIIGPIIHLFGLNFAIDFYQRMNLNWILGKAQEQRDKWLGKKLTQTKGGREREGRREDMKRKIAPGWDAVNHLVKKNNLVFPFVCRYIGSSWLSGSQEWIWNKTQRSSFHRQTHYIVSFLFCLLAHLCLTSIGSEEST